MGGTGVIITKTIDTKIKQANWSVDPCDGTGESGFNLDLKKIQMAYMDYSWYGAGKIRFGWKVNDGKIFYTHEFIHNNQLKESYFRSGNLPARYEVGTTTASPLDAPPAGTASMFAASSSKSQSWANSFDASSSGTMPIKRTCSHGPLGPRLVPLCLAAQCFDELIWRRHFFSGHSIAAPVTPSSFGCGHCWCWWPTHRPSGPDRS